ncbi:mannose-6-phosphate isomerase, class I [Oceanobacillus sp. 143]|uniref:Mannose-6-phosphate isomerase n=1 Tax=Oceanobacillus zhaokaii TaxID=2052660 RepID=A0A345PKH1_9BACI|nr:mannose-6-phosphate isomerase, class I [Oceanobacillus zhaokaii]AXI10501.1 mannose-6-phosphate isomerase, class I [Oceanobacillus zhaokaii]QGS69499.1 mannose-6-phosphate isomerase, class I [Oceanobacillus sp. 143]
MYSEPIFLQPVFQERIWGGQKLKKEYNYDIPFEKTGEAWVISAHPHGPSVIKNGPLEGKTLADVWQNYGELFNKEANNNEEYPLLIKILDAVDDLSVQVHPNDEFARKMEAIAYGKTECWYVLSAEPGAEIILGHRANSRAELERMIDNGEWENLLNRVKVRAGDFFYVPSGTIHAIGKGIVILETQQNSDITYRVYDYDRTDANGTNRELHLDRAKLVTTIPHQDPAFNQSDGVVGDLKMKRLVEEKYFTVYHWHLNGSASQGLDKNFLQVSVIAGNAVITVDGKSFEINKGSHFILPHTVDKYELCGTAEFVVSTV